MNDCGLCGATPKGVGTKKRTECDPQIHWVLNNWDLALRLDRRRRSRRRTTRRRPSI